MQKTSEMTRKTTTKWWFFDGFSKFLSFRSNSSAPNCHIQLSGQFRFSRHSWGPRGRLSSGVICIWKIYQLFCDSGAALADFFIFMKMLPNVSLISMVIKKVFLKVSIATISTFLQKCTLCRHYYGTSQPKFGQCEYCDFDWKDLIQSPSLFLQASLIALSNRRAH